MTEKDKILKIYPKIKLLPPQILAGENAYEILVNGKNEILQKKIKNYLEKFLPKSLYVDAFPRFNKYYRIWDYKNNIDIGIDYTLQPMQETYYILVLPDPTYIDIRFAQMNEKQLPNLKTVKF